jgi:hypothetical protein
MSPVLRARFFEPGVLNRAGLRSTGEVRQHLPVIQHLREIAHLCKTRSKLRSLRGRTARPCDDFATGKPVARRLRSRMSSATISRALDLRSLKMRAMNDVIQTGLRTALSCALFIIASGPSDAPAQSRHADAGAGGPRLSFLSEPRSEEQRPDEEMPRSTPEDDNRSFDGAWIFTSAGCRHTGSLPALIIEGKIVVRSGSGQVDPDGTLHSVGAGNGMTLSAVGRLSGNTGAGTFNRSDGCVGSWIAIKRRPSPKLRR